MPIRTLLPSYECRVPDVCLANGSNRICVVGHLQINHTNVFPSPTTVERKVNNNKYRFISFIETSNELVEKDDFFSVVAVLVIRLGNLVDLFEECFETITYLSHLIP